MTLNQLVAVTRLQLSQTRAVSNALNHLQNYSAEWEKLALKLRAPNITLLVIIACSSVDSLSKKRTDCRGSDDLLDKTGSNPMLRFAKAVDSRKTSVWQTETQEKSSI